jgi:predicted patatin/cPLA2 family phospholipase
MTPAKSPDQGSSRSSIATTAATTSTADSGRKPWKKKSAVEIVLGQIDRLREGVQQREEELKQAKRQLQKLEEARKILESA